MNEYRSKKNEDKYRGNGIMIRSLVNFEFDVRNNSNHMKKELKYFNQNECSIIMKLRTEYINLNQYLHYINFHPDGLCDHCGVEETVSHYLIDCVGYKHSVELDLHKDNVDFTIVRKKLRNKLKNIAIFFRNQANFTVENILFPHIWQCKPKYGNKNYTELMEKNLKRRIDILKAIIEFVRETKRFKNDFGY